MNDCTIFVDEFVFVGLFFGKFFTEIEITNGGSGDVVVVNQYVFDMTVLDVLDEIFL